MKKILLSSLIAAAAAVPAFAGINNINYQAVIKDGGTAVNDQKVTLKFELLDKSQTVVYTEEQTPTTTSTGYVSCKLGENADLSTLNWGDLTLKVSVDLGSGFEVISSGAVSSVPTALHALTSADTDTLREEVDAFATMVETRFDRVQDQVDLIFPEVEKLIEDNGETKATLLSMGADVAQIEGLAAQVEELNTNTDAFADMTEERFGKIEKELADAQANLENFGENFEKVGEIVRANETAIEELNTNTDAFATMAEARFDKVEKEIADAQANLENFGENFEKVGEIVRANETAIEELNTNTEAFAEKVETRFDKVEKELGDAQADIEDLAKKVNLVEESVKMIVDPSDPESIINSMSERMAAMENELMSKIAELEAEIAALKAK